MPPTRIGLIGCGGIAAIAHLPAMAHLRDRVRLVATADVRLEAARSAAAPWGATPYASYQPLLTRDDVDMVLIATPEHFHREQVVAAAEAGKHVLCEKPMAPSLGDADLMLAACRRAGVRLMIGHSRRATRRYIEVRQAIDRGDVGEVRLIRENERRPRRVPGTPGGYWHPGHWTADPDVSAGVALTNAIHEMDLLRWFAGARPITIFAEHAIIGRENPHVPDFMSFTIRFENGTIGSAEITNGMPRSYGAYHQLEVYGTQGAIRAKDTELIPITRYADEGAVHPETLPLLLQNLPAYIRQLAGFVAAIVGGHPVPLAPENARAALGLALAATRSARTGRAVHLEEDASA